MKAQGDDGTPVEIWEAPATYPEADPLASAMVEKLAEYRGVIESQKTELARVARVHDQLAAKYTTARERVAELEDQRTQLQRCNTEETERRRIAEAPRDQRQQQTQRWVREAFGEACATNLVERSGRLVEEALEAGQAGGLTQEQAEALVRYVYGRPVGAIAQEIGGVGITLLALAQLVGVSADGEEVRELARVLSKDKGELRERHFAKAHYGVALPPEYVQPATQDPSLQDAIAGGGC